MAAARSAIAAGGLLFAPAAAVAATDMHSIVYYDDNGVADGVTEDGANADADGDGDGDARRLGGFACPSSGSRTWLTCEHGAHESGCVS